MIDPAIPATLRPTPPESMVEGHALALLQIVRMVPAPVAPGEMLRAGQPQQFMVMPMMVAGPHIVLRYPPERANPHMLSWSERADLIAALQRRAREWINMGGPGTIGWSFAGIEPMRGPPPTMPLGPDGVLRPYPKMTLDLGC